MLAQSEHEKKYLAGSEDQTLKNSAVKGLSHINCRIASHIDSETKGPSSSFDNGGDHFHR